MPDWKYLKLQFLARASTALSVTLTAASSLLAYKNVFLLGEDNTFRRIDLGLVHSSAASSLVELIITRLKQEDLVVEGVSPNFLTRYWPPALTEWSTKSVRDAFFASPKFPRLVKADAVRETISRGLDAGLFAYVGKTAGGDYEPFVYKRSLAGNDVEISEDMFLISRERAEEYLKARESGATTAGTRGAAGTGPYGVEPVPNVPTAGTKGAAGPPAGATASAVTGFSWSGVLPAQKWMNFYTKVLSRFATGDGMKLTVTVDVVPTGGVPKSKIDETRVARRNSGSERHQRKSRSRGRKIEAERTSQQCVPSDAPALLVVTKETVFRLESRRIARSVLPCGVGILSTRLPMRIAYPRVL